VTLVLGTTAGGTGAHVRMLAAGLAGEGTAVAVAAPAAAGVRFGFQAVPAVTFVPVEIGERPRAGDLAVIRALRRLLTGQRSEPAGPAAAGQVAHAHGMRAGALTVLALLGVRGGGRPGVVVTVHNAPPGGRAARVVYRLLERVVARGADLVLCVSADLEERMRDAGARRVARAVVAVPGPSSAPGAGAGTKPGLSAAFAGAGPGAQPADGRPLVLAIGRLAAQKGLGALIDAAASWRDLQPPPLLVIAGDGPLAGELRARAAARGADVAFLGAVGDVPALLAAATVFVLPSQWEGQPLALQEALRAGLPVVATRVGGVPGLAGEDAALLVAPGDSRALAAAVRSVLTDPALAARLSVAARARAAALPSPAEATAAAVSAYSGLTRRARLR
jgi:glycosyltransferase involved in cell wall biosynthesis